MIDETTIQARIAALEKERDTVVAQANATIQAYNAAIGELTRLIAPPQAADPTEYIEQIAAERAA